MFDLSESHHGILVTDETHLFRVFYLFFTDFLKRHDLFFTPPFSSSSFSTPHLQCHAFSFPALLLWKTWDWGCRGNQAGFDWGRQLLGARLEDGCSRLTMRHYWFPVFDNYSALLRVAENMHKAEGCVHVCVRCWGWWWWCDCNAHFASNMQ